jgi:hypothetical protein
MVQPLIYQTSHCQMGPAESHGISVAAAKAIATPCQIIFNPRKPLRNFLMGHILFI